MAPIVYLPGDPDRDFLKLLQNADKRKETLIIYTENVDDWWREDPQGTYKGSYIVGANSIVKNYQRGDWGLPRHLDEYSDADLKTRMEDKVRTISVFTGWASGSPFVNRPDCQSILDLNFERIRCILSNAPEIRKVVYAAKDTTTTLIGLGHNAGMDGAVRDHITRGLTSLDGAPPPPQRDIRAIVGDLDNLADGLLTQVRELVSSFSSLTSF